MRPFTKFLGVVATMDRANVDTDQIIPKQFLKRIERTGFGPFLFYDWRYLDDGSDDPCAELGVAFAVTDHFVRGGAGATDLAETLIENAEQPSSQFRPLYDLSESVVDKIRRVATTMYGASDVHFTKAAARNIKQINRLGLSELPVCIAKTHSSLSDDPKLRGRPLDFAITVQEIQINSGAGFLVVLTGDIVRMPGLPRQPLAQSVDLADDRITGLR